MKEARTQGDSERVEDLIKENEKLQKKMQEKTETINRIQKDMEN